MPLKTEGLEEPSLNLTPMIDVVFLLIIFFLVGSHFSETERQFDVNLPKVQDAQPLTAPPDEIVVNVYQDGRILISEELLTMAQLEQKLSEAAKRFADQAVLIRAEGQGRYQRVVDVLVACHKAHIKNFSLAAEVLGEGS